MWGAVPVTLSNAKGQAHLRCEDSEGGDGLGLPASPSAGGHLAPGGLAACRTVVAAAGGSVPAPPHPALPCRQGDMGGPVQPCNLPCGFCRSGSTGSAGPAARPVTSESHGFVPPAGVLVSGGRARLVLGTSSWMAATTQSAYFRFDSTLMAVGAPAGTGPGAPRGGFPPPPSAHRAPSGATAARPAPRPSGDSVAKAHPGSTAHSVLYAPL